MIYDVPNSTIADASREVEGLSVSTGHPQSSDSQALVMVGAGTLGILQERSSC